MNKFDFDRDEATVEKTVDKSVKEVLTNIVANLSAIGSGMILFVFICVFFFDISFTTSFTVGLAADAITSTVLFLMFQGFQETSGRRAGKKDAEYTAAQAEYGEKLKKAQEHGLKNMQAFCDHYAAENLKTRRMLMLRPIGIKYDDYIEQYSDLSRKEVKRLKLSARKKAAIIYANGKKPIPLSEDTIILGDFGASPECTIKLSPEVKDRRQRSGKAVTIISAVFSAGITFGMTATPTAAKLAYCAFKLCFMLCRGIQSRYKKYILYSVDGVEYYKWLGKLIDMYLEWDVVPGAEMALDNIPTSCHVCT